MRETGDGNFRNNLLLILIVSILLSSALEFGIHLLLLDDALQASPFIHIVGGSMIAAMIASFILHRYHHVYDRLSSELTRHKQIKEELRHARSDVDAAEKYKDVLIRDLFEALDELLANRDHYTFEHALRVAEISKRIGSLLGLDQEELNVLETGCLVHDIGKIAIPDDVLLKPGRFDLQDRHIMEFHPVMGARLFANRHQDERLTRIILHHHERLDGSGYPFGLKQDEITDMVRIVAVADVYEALIARRPYKRPISREEALDILRRDAARGLMDSRMVQALEKITENWDPLEITRDFSAEYMQDLEVFRRMTYFREPLSDFYNYRYLLFLDEANLLNKSEEGYSIIMTVFNKLREFNQDIGYARADQILDQVGHNLHQLVEKYNYEIPGPGISIRLFRKGADYLIYSDHKGPELDRLYAGVSEQLFLAEENWSLSAKLVQRFFGRDYPVKQAMDEMLTDS